MARHHPAWAKTQHKQNQLNPVIIYFTTMVKALGTLRSSIRAGAQKPRRTANAKGVDQNHRLRFN